MRKIRTKFVESNIPPSLHLRVVHKREIYYNEELRQDEWHYAGVTHARLVDWQTGEVVAEGSAYVNPYRDHPSKKIGRSIAVGRALKNYFAPLEEFRQANYNAM